MLATQEAQPHVFRSLHYVEGLSLPEPVSTTHRSILWNATDLPSNLAEDRLTEGRLVYRTTNNMNHSTVDNDEGFQEAKHALQDIEHDGLLIPRARFSSGVNRFNLGYPYNQELSPLRLCTPYVELSLFGLQIATESARRALQAGVRHYQTAAKAKRVYEKGLIKLLAVVPADKPRPRYL